MLVIGVELDVRVGHGLELKYQVVPGDLGLFVVAQGCQVGALLFVEVGMLHLS